MKFLTVPRLAKLSSLLQSFDLGDQILRCRVESYSCKIAGEDKKISKTISKQISSETSSISLSFPADSLDPLASSHNRKLFISLITTMNASFPDYDFSSVKPEQFNREPMPQIAVNSINNLFVDSLELAAPGLRTEFWSAINETMETQKCEIYSFQPEIDSEMNIGKLWIIHYFFYNRKAKKILFLSAHSVSKLHQHSNEQQKIFGKNFEEENNQFDEEFDDESSRSDYADEYDEESDGVEVDLLDWEDDSLSGSVGASLNEENFPPVARQQSEDSAFAHSITSVSLSDLKSSESNTRPVLHIDSSAKEVKKAIKRARKANKENEENSPRKQSKIEKKSKSNKNEKSEKNSSKSKEKEKSKKSKGKEKEKSTKSSSSKSRKNSTKNEKINEMTTINLPPVESIVNA